MTRLIDGDLFTMEMGTKCKDNEFSFSPSNSFVMHNPLIDVAFKVELADMPHCACCDNGSEKMVEHSFFITRFFSFGTMLMG